jgi:hypothetical protein
MDRWYSGIYKALLISSAILFSIGIFSSGSVALGAYITGYSLLILSIMMILVVLSTASSTENGTFQIMLSIVRNSGPFILMLGVIGFVLYMLITYKNNIISGHVSNSYYSFSNVIILLLLTQMYIVYSNIRSNNLGSSGSLNKITSSILYLLGVIMTICSLLLFTILKYYTTDGFSIIKL